jgi:hypothetical protein
MAASEQPRLPSLFDVSAIASMFAASTGELIHRHLLGELKKDDEINTMIKEIMDTPVDPRADNDRNNVQSLPGKTSARTLRWPFHFKSSRRLAPPTGSSDAIEMQSTGGDNGHKEARDNGNAPVEHTGRQSSSASIHTIVGAEVPHSQSVRHPTVAGTGIVPTENNNTISGSTTPSPPESNEPPKLLDAIKTTYQKRKAMEADCYLHRIRRKSSNILDPRSTSRNCDIKRLNGSLTSYVRMGTTRLRNRLKNKTYHDYYNFH